MVVQEEIALEFEEDVSAFAENSLDILAGEEFSRDVITGRLASKHLAGRKVLV